MKRFSFLIFFILTGCDDSQRTHETLTVKPTPQIVEIDFLAPILSTLEKSTIAFDRNCMKPLDVCWYGIERSANDKNLITLNLTINETILSLEESIDIEIFSDTQVSKDVETLNVILRGLPNGSTHEQYRTRIFNLIEKIKDAGWSHFFMPEDPRISGTQIEKISTPQDVLGRYVSSHPWLDPNYQLDLKRWLQVGVFYNWYFYNNGNHLHLKAWRRDDETSPDEKATYLITLEFQSERQFWLSGFSEEQDRTHWKERLPKRLENYRAARNVLEEKARAAGIDIDETYQDPPIQALSK